MRQSFRLASLSAAMSSILFLMPYTVMAQENKETQDSEQIEITIPQYIVGGILGTTLGFGIGHGVQHRYKQKGWVFTLLEGIAAGVFIAGAANCPGDDDPDNKGSSGDDDIFDDLAGLNIRNARHTLASSSCPGAPALLIGAGSLIGFHIWETVDVWSKPKFNLEKKMFYAENQGRIAVGIVPIQLGVSDDVTAALSVAWTH